MISVPIKLLRDVCKHTKGESCVELSYHREAVKCGDCGVVSEEDGWCSVVEHKYNCEYKLQLEAREEIMDIINKEANSSNVLQGTL